jgi:hypothetical protein
MEEGVRRQHGRGIRHFRRASDVVGSEQAPAAPNSIVSRLQSEDGGSSFALPSSLYAGNILICTGIFPMHGNKWTVLFGTLTYVLLLAAIVRAEEAHLLQAFGSAYEDYSRRIRPLASSSGELGSRSADAGEARENRDNREREGGDSVDKPVPRSVGAPCAFSGESDEIRMTYLRQFRPEWGAQIVDMIDSGVAFSRKRGAT